jgi:hypothetical protein
VVVDELLLFFGGHGVEGVEFTSEFAFEAVAGRKDLGHDGVTLLVGDARSKSEVFEVATNSDTGRFDEGAFFSGEGRALELGSFHVRDVQVSGGVGVVLLDDSVEEVAEGGVGVFGTGVAANAGVDVLAAREDASLERDAALVDFIVILLPDLSGEVLGDKRLAVLGELRPELEVFGGLQVGTALGSLDFTGGGLGGGAGRGRGGGGLGDALGGVAAHWIRSLR